MKIIYYSQPFLADCDFPLIREMQNQGYDVYCYLCINRGFKAKSILEFDKPLSKFGFFKASKMPEFDKYKDCIDLSRLFIIGQYSSKWYFFPKYIIWFITFIHMMLQKADIFQIDWQLFGAERILKYLPGIKKRVMTVHDPFQHEPENERQDKFEQARLQCFKWADEFILLNNNQVNSFAEYYGIPLSKISTSSLGAYDCVSRIPTNSPAVSCPYILFSGQLAPYKGLEYLLEAMPKVHDAMPDLKLIIASSGKIYFDDTKYKKLDYIEWRNRYIGISELASLIKGALFSVCPYVSTTQSGVIQTLYILNCPVIATNVGSLPFVVKNEETGIIVPPQDSDALAEAIIDLLNSPEKVLLFKKNIKEKWMPTMSWEPIVKEYLKVYEK